MKERSKQVLQKFMRVALLSLLLILPMNVIQANAAATKVNPLTISRPNEIMDNVHKETGLIYEVGDAFPATYYYYTFTIPERGWVLFYETVEFKWLYIDISASSSFNSTISRISYEKNYHNEGGTLLKYYLDAGTYYIKAPEDRTPYSAYMYFLPNSKFFTDSLSSVDCSSKTLTVESKIFGTSTQVRNEIVPTFNVNNDHTHSGITSANDIYNITENGEYTLCAWSSLTEWKTYKFIKSYEIYDLGNHSAGSTTITKASNGKDGSTVKRCTKCGNITGTTIISKISDIKLSNTVYTYTGRSITPAVTVTDGNGNIVSASNYNVTYSNNTNVGKATVSVTFKGASYEGSVNKTFDIVASAPEAVRVTGVKPGKKKLKVTWKKGTSDINGYEVQVSTSKKFGKAATKTSIVKSRSKTSVTVKGLKAKKKYYVRVRTYKNVGSKQYCSSWSNVLKIKVKK
ncbi:MAG: fibronectin type III domain-containing protein [Eubacteriales bacterium]|nr:fibronectin type III domain-containing protein [Eubacteriales bacterium]